MLQRSVRVACSSLSVRRHVPDLICILARNETEFELFASLLE
jgi:hypothetical protein